MPTPIPWKYLRLLCACQSRFLSTGQNEPFGLEVALGYAYLLKFVATLISNTALLHRSPQAEYIAVVASAASFQNKRSAPVKSMLLR